MNSTKDSTIWGPPFWFMLHNGASSYPVNPSQKRRRAMTDFLYGMSGMLPCQLCRKHLDKFMTRFSKNEIEYIVSSRHRLFDFFVHLHNIVNKRLGKPCVSIERARYMYNV